MYEKTEGVKSMRETRCDGDSQVHVHSGWMVVSMAFSGPLEGKALGNKNTDNATDERSLAGYGWYSFNRGKQSTESSDVTFQEFGGGEGVFSSLSHEVWLCRGWSE